MTRKTSVEIRHNVPLFPLHTVLFPGMMLPLRVFEPRYLRMFDRVLNTREEFGVVLIAKGSEVGGEAIPHDVGTLARVVRMERAEDGTLHVMAQGTRRFRVQALNRQQPYLQARVEVVIERWEETPRTYALAMKVREIWERYVVRLKEVIGLNIPTHDMPTHASDIAFYVASSLRIGVQDRQYLLTRWDTAEMLRAEIRILRREMSLLRFIERTQERENELRLGPTGYLSRN